NEPPCASIDAATLKRTLNRQEKEDLNRRGFPRRQSGLDHLLAPVFVDELYGSVRAACKELPVRGIGFATEAHTGAVFRRGDFHIRSALGVDKAQQNGLRITSRPIRHF